MKWFWAAGLLSSCLVSCLPSDTRPTPGSAMVMLRGSETIKSGIPQSSFSDGWSVTFDEFLVSLGGASFGGDGCTAYENDFYRRIFDASVLEPQKVALKYALGTCEFGFRVSTPDSDSILSAGVTEQDKTMMRTGGTDPYSNGVAGVSIYVAGRATDGTTTKTFHWSFRGRRVVYGGCSPDFSAVPQLHQFTGGSEETVELGIRGEPLFFTALDPNRAKLHFKPYALADERGDGNGDITLEELAKVTLEDAGISTADLTPPGDAGVGSDADAGLPTFMNFEDFVYLGLFPHVVTLGQNGWCNVQISKPRD